MIIEEGIKKLILGQDLLVEEARDITNSIMEGNTTSAQIGAYLTALAIKGETKDEILGTVLALKEKMLKVQDYGEYLIDTCGTGGDGGKTFNISTAVAIVAASGGVKVAKHGNVAVSSKSGSADVLRELGIRTDFLKEEAEEEIKNKGMAFLFAPNFHSAMKNVGKERRELKIRTIFNLVGPLANPAPIKGQLVGVFKKDLVSKIAEVELALGLERALVVCGEDGLDEISIIAPTNVCEINNGRIMSYSITPEDFGLKQGTLEEIQGGTPKENKEIIIKVLKGETGARRDIVLLNAAAALYVGKKVETIKAGVELAKTLIDSGKAYEKYIELSS